MRVGADPAGLLIPDIVRIASCAQVVALAGIPELRGAREHFHIVRGRGGVDLDEIEASIEPPRGDPSREAREVSVRDEGVVDLYHSRTLAPCLLEDLCDG